MEKPILNTSYDPEIKCVDLIQTHLEVIRKMLEKSHPLPAEVLDQVAAVRFAVRSLESTLLEKKMATQLAETLQNSNVVHRARQLQKTASIEEEF